jgi:hypothetical protein
MVADAFANNEEIEFTGVEARKALFTAIYIALYDLADGTIVNRVVNNFCNSDDEELIYSLMPKIECSDAAIKMLTDNVGHTMARIGFNQQIYSDEFKEEVQNAFAQVVGETQFPGVMETLTVEDFNNPENLMIPKRAKELKEKNRSMN